MLLFTVSVKHTWFKPFTGYIKYSVKVIRNSDIHVVSATHKKFKLSKLGISLQFKNLQTSTEEYKFHTWKTDVFTILLTFSSFFRGFHTQIGFGGLSFRFFAAVCFLASFLRWYESLSESMSESLKSESSSSSLQPSSSDTSDSSDAFLAGWLSGMVTMGTDTAAGSCWISIQAQLKANSAPWPYKNMANNGKKNLKC